jgi:hypothetical protein
MVCKATSFRAVHMVSNIQVTTMRRNSTGRSVAMLLSELGAGMLGAASFPL